MIQVREILSLLVIINFFSCQAQEFIKWQTLRYKNLPANVQYNQSVIVPFGVSHHRGKVFVSLPRRYQIPSVLNTVELIGNPPYTNPLLIPYPNFDVQSITENPQANSQKIISVYRTRVDRCGFLWFVDTGVLEYSGNRQVVQRPSLWAINLNTDQVTWRYEIPADVVSGDGAGMADVTIDDDDCQNVFAYIPDIYNHLIVVVDTKNSRSWRFTHNYMRANPFEGDLSIDGLNFQWDDGIFSIALSNKNSDGYRIAFFHPLASHAEFTVSTKVLKNQALASRRTHGNDFKFIGYSSNRGNHVFDPKNRVLFAAEMQKNGISCWDPKGKGSMKSSQVQVVAQNNQTMIYPASLNMDQESTIWVLSNRLPRIIYGNLDYSLYNFNVFTFKPDEVIKGTTCGQNVGSINSGNNANNAGNEIGVGGDFQNKIPNFYGGGGGGGSYGSSSSASASASSSSLSGRLTFED